MTSSPEVSTAHLAGGVQGDPDGSVAECNGQLLSLLFPRGGGPQSQAEEPGYFRDLNLDQMVTVLFEGHDDPGRLATLFYVQAGTAGVVKYRQDIFRDLEDPVLRSAVGCFRERIDQVRRHVAGLEKRHDRWQRQAWFLDAAVIYCDAVVGLDDGLRQAQVRSAGLAALRDAVAGYRNGPGFSNLFSDAQRVRGQLSAITYGVRVRGATVEVSRYQDQGDYSEAIEDTFRRFRQGDVTDYSIAYRTPPHLGQVGSNILGRVSRLFPEQFAALEEFCQRHRGFHSDQIRLVDFETGFYLAYLDYIDPIRSAGLAFCYPRMAEDSAATVAEDAFDIVLAHKLVVEGRPVVPNSLQLEGAERIFVVTGPNQGGKTTFARMLGQLHHLAALGCPVPGVGGRLALFDGIFTHFQIEESLSDLRGKLEDDLVRMRAILGAATDRSIVIMNEVFASTTLADAGFLGAKVMEKLVNRGVRGVYVTFVDELAELGPQVVSLVSQVVPEDPARRTFRIVRAPAYGLAYAMALAEKYGVTYERLIQVLDR